MVRLLREPHSLCDSMFLHSAARKPAQTLRCALKVAPAREILRDTDKSLMARIDPELRILKPLLAHLEREYRKHERAWVKLLDARALRSFRRDIDALGELLESPSDRPDPARSARMDRVRSQCAELLVAARLLSTGCRVEHEVETPSGKHVDFRALRNDAVLHVHVKRAPRPSLRDADARVASVWRTLERVERGLTVTVNAVAPPRGAARDDMLRDAREFLEQASVGDECTLHDATGHASARLRAIAPNACRHIELVPDLSASFDEHVPRFQATLRKAFSQFMPRGENLIVLCGSVGGFEPFATALLGSHIERWDKRPRVGELIAYGRGGDGFWAGGVRNQSRLAAYWTLARGSEPLLFLREPLAGPSAKAPSERARAACMLAREIFA